MKTYSLSNLMPQLAQVNSNQANNRTKRLLIIIALTTSSALTITSCSSGGGSMNQALSKAGAPMASPAKAPAPSAPEAMDVAAEKKTSNEAAKPRPQLIKRAELTLIVKSIDESTKAVSKLVQKQQGDILGFQNQKPPDSSIRHTASMQIRVPEEKLDSTLNAMAKLGTVENRALSAEDVTDQLVDSEARLRNLRKSEEMVLKIMDRSGSIGDVLKASQELGKIRESIERIDAQLKSLRNQVAYSTINLTLEAAVSATQTPEPSIALRMQESWGKATHSVSEFTLSLFALCLWLLAYSPYFLLIAGGVYGLTRLRKQSVIGPVQEPKSPSSNIDG
ncbi:hypothetical protein BCD67_21975 [Oscillatoriales cyanobacterium USR001]|nr:hypothetical protein BCD67_21975 [Oscillatoriales cyanobacterium USR001]